MVHHDGYFLFDNGNFLFARYFSRKRREVDQERKSRTLLARLIQSANLAALSLSTDEVHRVFRVPTPNLIKPFQGRLPLLRKGIGLVIFKDDPAYHSTRRGVRLRASLGLLAHLTATAADRTLGLLFAANSKFLLELLKPTVNSLCGVVGRKGTSDARVLIPPHPAASASPALLTTHNRFFATALPIHSTPIPEARRSAL